MKILVIGGGGREHVIVSTLAKDSRVNALWCAPGNPGIAKEHLTNGHPVTCLPHIKATDLPALLEFAKQEMIDLTAVGPEDPLVAGIVDLFEQNGLRIWGPAMKAARFEASKIYTHNFNLRHGIDQPEGRAFNSRESGEAKRYAANLPGGCAVKADGLALGKGVIICKTPEKIDEAIDDMLKRGKFGDAGLQILIQKLIPGYEVSAHAFCDGKTFKMFPLSQDNKGSLEGNQGDNTGGMGVTMRSVTLGVFLDGGDAANVEKLVKRWHDGCLKEDIHYRGIIYPGLMMETENYSTVSRPRVLEYNARFGDPETEAYMTQLQTPLLDLFLACVEGTLDKTELLWKPGAAVCIIMASTGYPKSKTVDAMIEGIDEAEKVPDTKVYHCGTAIKNGRLVTAGGRVLAVTSRGKDLYEARTRAYEAVKHIWCSALWYRKDIGTFAP